MPDELNITKKAVLAAGGGQKVADALGVSYESIRRWQNADNFDACHVRQLCEMTGGTFTPQQLRPDIYGGG